MQKQTLETLQIKPVMDLMADMHHAFKISFRARATIELYAPFAG